MLNQYELTVGILPRPKSSFRMTIKGRLIRIDKTNPACHSVQSEESRVLNGQIVQNDKTNPACHSERSEESRVLNGRIINYNR